MSVTIKDIAHTLGLNFSTVSRALNKKPGVRKETRELIIKTANDMGYRPNTVARELVNRSENTNFVIIRDTNDSQEKLRDKEMIKELRFKNKKLEKEILRKNKALAEMELVILMKYVDNY